MRKATLIAIALLLPAVSLLASPVKKSAAKATATAFLQKQVSHSNGAKHAPRKLELVSAEADNAPYYVFNNQNGEGFAIVSGDDTVENPILGYSTEGNLSEEIMPEALRDILADYATVVEFAQQNGLSMKRAPRKIVGNDIPQLISFKWDQSEPYNNEIPGAGSKTHCSTGCMAVTTSMILAYYKYPETLHEVLGYSSGAVVNEYLEAWSPDYDNFGNSYTSSYGIGNLPKFMHYVANSLGTTYEEDGSGAKGSSFIPTMKGWGYSPNMRSVQRDSYSAEEWDQIIYNELIESRPVFLYGYGNDVMGGHSYLCDGYRKSDGFFHINWGWGGTCDGYFDMAVLNPFLEYFNQWNRLGYPCAPTGFTGRLMAVVGIKVAEEGEVVNTTDIVLTPDAEHFYSSGTTITGWFYNYNTTTFRGYVSWAVLHDDGTFDKIDGAPNTRANNISDGSMQTISVNVAQIGLGKGSYVIVPICKNDGATDWSLCEGYSEKYAEVTVDGDIITVITHPVKDIEVEGVYYAGTVSNYYEVIVTLKNNGDDIFGNLYVTGEYNGTSLNGTSMSVGVKAGETQSVSSFIDKPGGYGTTEPFKVIVKYQNNLLWEGYVSTPTMYTSDILYTDFKMENETKESSKSIVLGTELNGYVELTADDSDFKLPVRILLTDNEGKEVYSSAQQYYVKDGDSQRYQFNITGLEAGKTYTMFVDAIKASRTGTTYTETVWKRFFGSSGWPIELLTGLYYMDENGQQRTATGTSSITLSGNLAAVDVRTVNPAIVDFSGITNENCVYVFNAGDEVPAELDGKNVVVGNTAAKITLAEGKPVAFPTSFTATEISYTRTFTVGNNGDGKGWQTIVLPFSAKVSVDGKDQPWFKSDDDSGLKFWLYRYTGSIDGTVYFDYETASQMTADEPYIISVPGDAWGPKYDLTDKEFTFSATNAQVKGNVKPEKTAGFYILKGTYGMGSFADAYLLNEDGDFFELTDAGEETPFHAIIMPKDGQSGGKLGLGFEMGELPTAINGVTVDGENNAPVFDLQGRRIENAQKGLYIRNGKKVVIK